METLAPVWVCNPGDPADPGQRPPAVWESVCVFDSSPPGGRMWAEQLSPHLQKNKQLQDTLLQREEEVARLQEENNELRHFLSSSFVRNLELKARRLAAGRRRSLKRNLMDANGDPSHCCRDHLPPPPQVRKRVCRNLTAEFCGDAVKTSPSSEPNLDLWVLQTLGLKDRDTIDTSSGAMPPLFALCGQQPSFLHSAASPPASLVPDRCLIPQGKLWYRPPDCQEAHGGSPAQSPRSCPVRSNLTAAGPRRRAEDPECGRSYYGATTTAFQTGLMEDGAFTASPQRPPICSNKQSPLQTLEGHPARSAAHWTTSPEPVPFSPVSSSTLARNQQWSSSCSQPPSSPSAGSWTRADLAFSMSLSPSSSVRTHSFPQGQAFTRKDPGGRWNFTWMPTQGP